MNVQDRFDPMRYVIVAADSIERLRNNFDDICRVLEFAHSEGRLDEMETYLSGHRPDLADCLAECVAEVKLTDATVTPEP
jgi:hypothetical protein